MTPIICSSCDYKIANIIDTDKFFPNYEFQELVFKCPKCNDESFVYRTHYQVRIINVDIIDMIIEDNRSILKVNEYREDS